MSRALENIEKSVLEMYINNPELAKEELSAAGYNVDSLVSDGLNLIKQLQFKKQVETKKNLLQDLFSKAKVLLTEKAKASREDALAIIAQYQVKVQYRNIDTFTDEELNDILKDVDIRTFGKRTWYIKARQIQLKIF